MSGVVARIETLFATRGGQAYDGARRESVTALEHALQCAQLAEWAGAAPAQVAAALLHDIGHFIDDPSVPDDTDDAHERRALPLLAEAFGAEVTEPVRLHVQAKRYLVVADARYAATLSPASTHSLALQGGPMTLNEARAFEAQPFARQAVMLRRWDDAAKEPGRLTPEIGYYMLLLDEIGRRD